MMRTITVKGVGSVTTKPDYVVIRLTLNTRNMDYAKMMSQANDQIDELNKSVVAIGFTQEALKTIDFTIDTRYESCRDKADNYTRVFKGDECDHELKLAFDFDKERLSKVISAIANCEAKPELSISFTVKNPMAVNDTLLYSATQNARRKAEILCHASNEQLGKPLSIQYAWDEINIYSHTKFSTVCESSWDMMSMEPDNIEANDTATFIWEVM